MIVYHMTISHMAPYMVNTTKPDYTYAELVRVSTLYYCYYYYNNNRFMVPWSLSGTIQMSQ